MIVSMMTLPPLIVFGRRFRFIDEPSPRKVHSNPIPRIGGVAIGLALFVSVAVVDHDLLSGKYIAVLLAGLLVLAVGAIDDRHELGYRAKFAAQILAAIIVVYGGGISINAITLTSSMSIAAWIADPVSVFVIVALANAVALSDGLDGLAGGIVFICCSALAVLGYLNGNITAALIAAALSGAIFGFLRFNTHPAVIFMGDSGSQFLGLMSAVLAIDVTQTESGRIAATLPLLLLAVPVLDTLQVMVSRVLRGKSPFKPDKFHLHHRLLALGFAHHHTVLIIYLLQCGFFLLAFFFRFESDLLIGGMFIAIGALLLASVLAAQAKRSRVGGQIERATPRWSLAGAARQRIAGIFAVLVMAFIVSYVILMFVMVGLQPPPPDANGQMLQVQQLALILLAAVIASFVVSSKGTAAILSQTVGYVVAAMLAFTASSITVPGSPLSMLESLLLVLIGGGNVVWLLLSERREMQMTTLDVLIIFGALVVPNLPILNDTQGIAALILRLVCLFYAVEVVAAAYRSRIFFRIALVACLALIAVNRPFTELSSTLSSFNLTP